MIKKKWVVSAGLCCLLSLSSCQNKTEGGALSGGAIGAIAGGLIEGGPGGIILGGAIGAITGGLIGHSLDENEKRKLDQESPGTSRRVERNMKLSVTDIVALIHAGVNNSTIMAQIQKTHSTFNMTAADIIQLKEGGADETLINFMIQNES